MVSIRDLAIPVPSKMLDRKHTFGQARREMCRNVARSPPALGYITTSLCESWSSGGPPSRMLTARFVAALAHDDRSTCAKCGQCCTSCSKAASVMPAEGPLCCPMSTTQCAAARAVWHTRAEREIDGLQVGASRGNVRHAVV
jgi:hypothetical protein